MSLNSSNDPVIQLINEGDEGLQIEDYGRLSDFFVGWFEEEIETYELIRKRQEKP